uniref:Carboxylesterase type B domain-containing protein n=1 Tax=Acrobeloides nanus TaxID=290746 RepID=A0A914BXK8_9BILA
MITVPVFQDVELRRAHGEVTYLFMQTHAPKNCCGDPPIAKGAVHSNELAPLFGLSFWGKYEPDEDDIKFKNVLLDGFRNFIKTGSPSSPKQTWPPITKEHPTKHLVVQPEPEIREEFLPDRMKFWTEELPNKVGVGILKKTRLPAAELHRQHTEL